jgi:L-amino acid N-acyltransferase YncA
MYVERHARGAGVGKTLLNALAEAAERRGLYKLVGKIFTTNETSIALVGAWRLSRGRRPPAPRAP